MLLLRFDGARDLVLALEAQGVRVTRLDTSLYQGNAGRVTRLKCW